MYVFKFVSNFSDIIAIVESHYNVNEISKCFV